jgi:hypothetical protein
MLGLALTGMAWQGMVRRVTVRKGTAGNCKAPQTINTRKEHQTWSE